MTASTGRQYSTPPRIPGLTFVEPLGKGGYADVFLYEQQMPRMKIAVKVLMAEGLTEAVRRQFTAEGNAMAELADHPYIVQVFQAGIADDGRPYLCMKYYPQPNLGVRARQDQIPVAEVLSIGIEIASAVQTAHSAGILHRDIKPANILTGQYGAPGLTDFGISATKASDTPENTAANPLEAEGMSIPWSPPEVLFAAAPADERSDIYSLAATLWQLLVGRSPFEIPGGDNSSLALMRRIHDDPPPRTGRPDVPASLDRLLQQAMAKDPASRPGSALALARGLQAVEQEQGFGLTRIVVAADAQPAFESDDDGSDTTRVRNPVRIAAQPPVQPRYSAQAPAHVPAVAPAAVPRWQQSAEIGPDDGTALRAKPLAVTREPDRKTGVRPAWIFAAIGALAVIGVVVGVLVSGGGSSDPKPTVVSQPTDTDALLSPDAPTPGTPVVKATRLNATTVRFTWTYDSRLADDSFRLVEKPGHTATTTKPSVQLTTARNATQCLTVTVFRHSGASVSDPSARVCR